MVCYRNRIYCLMPTIAGLFGFGRDLILDESTSLVKLGQVNLSN